MSYLYKINILLILLLSLFTVSFFFAGNANAAGAALNTSIPKKNYNIPPSSLGKALATYSAESGVALVFDPALTEGKTSTGIQGEYGLNEGFSNLLKGTGLEVVNDESGDLTLRKAPVATNSNNSNLPLDVELSAVNVRAQRFYEVGPLGGTGLTKEQIPGNVQSLTAKDIKDAHALSITDLMNSKLQSVNVNDYQGNPFQMDVQYRGFTAGPEIGTPQGLAVFMDGIRVNEPFGDVVNWDMLPLNALASFDVIPGSNPIFGLGALGGAISMKTKDGFNHPGVDAEVLTGSFGRRQLQASGGWNNGIVGLFGAGNFFLEDGWRENSPSKVNQVFGKGSYRGEKLDLNLSSLVVWNDLIGNGMLPSEMYKQDRNGVFTSPDSTDNRLFQFQLAGSYFVNDNFTVTGQVYRRNSKRHAIGADVYTEFGSSTVKRNLRSGEQFTCLFNSTNDYGLPDYYVVDVPDPNDPFSSTDLFNFFISGTPLPGGSFNQALPTEAADFIAGAQANFNGFWKNYRQVTQFTAQAGSPPPMMEGEVTPYSNSAPSYRFDSSILVQYRTVDGNIPGDIWPLLAIESSYYFTPDGVKHLVIPVPPNNACTAGVDGPGGTAETGLDPLEVPGPTGHAQTVDGAAYGGTGTGVVEGTPTAVFTDNQIDQITDGASIQFNWNYPKHKFMVGASIDAPSAKYKSGQMLGMLDANRDAYLAPDEVRDQYAAASQEISNNNFKGSQLTKSIYASETWSPIETLHITGAARYNETRGKNKIASRTFGFTVFDLAQFEAFPNDYDVCINDICPTTGYVVPDVSKLLNKPEKEKFSYYSLNPSLGATWQATPTLNIYSNWAQGTRTPSVIELGCAFDDTPVANGFNPDGSVKYLAKSLHQNRACSLPSTLSGDPYLPQIRAQTIDLGMRGIWSNNIQWNLGVYQTDLKDDIYMVTFPGDRSFFDTIGDTRRRGVEAGIAGAFGKASFRVNYALTDATFQDEFDLAAHDNSSSIENVWGNNDYGRTIRVKPGNRMPGVPLHNLNASLSYAVTSKWNVGLTAIAHSMAYVRGNENNKHRVGVTMYETFEDALTGTPITVARKPTTNSGKVGGYMVFNFHTSYQLAPEWRLGLQVNNILDKEYFSAGRLGRNPFSPSVYGAIGPDGYNHNSSDWLSTNFLAPGAPRAAWVSLSYEFKPNR